MTRVLLVSSYEQGHQPLGLASPAAALRAAGHEVDTLDLSLDPPDADTIRAADLIALSVPMHTAARLAMRLAERLCGLVPGTPLVLYGLYASEMDGQAQVSGLIDAVVGGEYEGPLVALAEAVAGGGPLPAAPGGQFDAVPGAGPQPLFPREAMPLPDRAGLPSLDRYARATVLDREGRPQERLTGYVEASRGCAHRCRHCPLTPTYAGRLRLVPPELVLADIDAQVRLGAQHITFGDPDFFNTLPHSTQLLRMLRRRHPDLTYDVTIKVEHLLEHPDAAGDLPRLGVAWVTSAFESVDDVLLQRLDKGHTRADMEAALDLAAAAGLVLRPTWLPFTPWTALRDFAAILDFIAARGLVQHTQPVQYALRLLLPPGSPLIDDARREGHLRDFDPQGLTYAWTSPDPAVDALQAEIANIVAGLACAHDAATDNTAVFNRIRALTAKALGTAPPGPVEAPPGHVPGLSEAWFC